MTDYAKYIKVFEAARRERVNGYIIDQECLDAAIEAMQELDALKAKLQRVEALLGDDDIDNDVGVRTLRAALADSGEKPEPKHTVTTRSGHRMCAICYELNGQCSDCASGEKP